MSGGEFYFSSKFEIQWLGNGHLINFLWKLLIVKGIRFFVGSREVHTLRSVVCTFHLVMRIHKKLHYVRLLR